MAALTRAYMKKLRAEAARGFGPIEGRSVTARLVVEGADIELTFIEKPIMYWVEGLWERLVDERTMNCAWRQACAELAGIGDRDDTTLGGARAHVKAVRRLGWGMPTFDTVITRDKTILYFGRGAVPGNAMQADAWIIKRYVEDDFERVALKGSALERDINDIEGGRGYCRMVQGGMVEQNAARIWRRGRFEHEDGRAIPWLWPVRTVVRAARRAGNHKAAPCLRSLAEGGWRTQKKLHAEGRANHSRCACGQEEGDIWHKLGRCQLTEEHREKHCPPWLQKAGAVSPWDPLFSRGVPARPKPVAVGVERTWCLMAEGESDRVITGEVYTDGSAHGAFWKAARGGWCVVVMEDRGQWRWTLYGTVGGSFVDSYVAELKAILEAVRIAIPPITIYTDNAELLRDSAKGKAWCVAAKTRGASMWRDIWRYMEELGLGLRLEKVKAHTSWNDVLLRKISHVHHVGNGRVDEGAKAAARAAEKEAPTKAFNAQLKKALAWCKWVLCYAAAWKDDVDPVERVNRDEGWIRGGGFGDGGEGLPHELWKLKGEFLCRRCGAKAGGTEAAAGLLQRPCGGCAAGRAAAQVTGNKNFVWSKYAISWMEVQSKGAMLVAVVPIPRALVDYGRLDEVVQVQRDGHGARILPQEDVGAGHTVLQRGEAEADGGGDAEEGRLRLANTYGARRRAGKAAGKGEGLEAEGGVGGADGWDEPWRGAPGWMPRHLELPHERQWREGGGGGGASSVSSNGDQEEERRRSANV